LPTPSTATPTTKMPAVTDRPMRANPVSKTRKPGRMSVARESTSE